MDRNDSPRRFHHHVDDLLHEIQDRHRGVETLAHWIGRALHDDRISLDTLYAQIERQAVFLDELVQCYVHLKQEIRE